MLFLQCPTVFCSLSISPSIQAASSERQNTDKLNCKISGLVALRLGESQAHGNQQSLGPGMRRIVSVQPDHAHQKLPARALQGKIHAQRSRTVLLPLQCWPEEDIGHTTEATEDEVGAAFVAKDGYSITEEAINGLDHPWCSAKAGQDRHLQLLQQIRRPVLYLESFSS